MCSARSPDLSSSGTISRTPTRWRKGRTRRGRIVNLLPHHQFDLGRQFVDRLVTLDDPAIPGTIIAEQGVGGPRQCLGHQRKELRHPKVDGDTFGQAGVHGDPTIIARADATILARSPPLVCGR